MLRVQKFLDTKPGPGSQFWWVLSSSDGAPSEHWVNFETQKSWDNYLPKEFTDHHA